MIKYHILQLHIFYEKKIISTKITKRELKIKFLKNKMQSIVHNRES